MVGLNDLKCLFQPVRFSDFTVSKCVLKPEDIQKYDQHQKLTWVKQGFGRCTATAWIPCVSLVSNQLPSWSNWLGSHSNPRSIPVSCRTSADENPTPPAHSISDIASVPRLRSMGQVPTRPHPPQHPALANCLPQLCSESQPTLGVGPVIQWTGEACWKPSDHQVLQQVSR